MLRIASRFAAVLTLTLASVSVATALPAQASATVSSVTFTGTSTAPTLTINGYGLGKAPPTAFSAATTSCGVYGPDNGNWYGKSGLFFLDDINGWEAGKGTAKGGNCIGIVVDSWSKNKVVLHFGVAYGTEGNWHISAGDNYVISVKGWLFGGVASFS